MPEGESQPRNTRRGCSLRGDVSNLLQSSVFRWCTTAAHNQARRLAWLAGSFGNSRRPRLHGGSIEERRVRAGGRYSARPPPPATTLRPGYRPYPVRTPTVVSSWGRRGVTVPLATVVLPLSGGRGRISGGVPGTGLQSGPGPPRCQKNAGVRGKAVAGGGEGS